MFSMMRNAVFVRKTMFCLENNVFALKNSVLNFFTPLEHLSFAIFAIFYLKIQLKLLAIVFNQHV